MTYVSKKEKVFDLPDQDENSSTSLLNSESKLKRFASVSDRRAWASEECQRYQHFYGLVNGSESSVSKSSSFKYIPFDVLLAILMAEKDAYIQELLEKQGENGPEVKAKMLFKSDGYEDSDDDREALIRKDAEVVALKNKIAGLESELEDYRDTITKAMHKLENMDAIINENNFLKEKIKCSEGTIKHIEEKKAKLERELESYKSTYNPDGMSRKYKPLERKHQWDGGDCDGVVSFSPERDVLNQKIQELQKQLEIANKNAAEAEALKQASQETSSRLEELSKENECYKQRIESMTYLEKKIDELKKQGQTLTEKYKRESQKANDFLKQIQQNSIELEGLKQERDSLQFRVNELMNYESSYLSLKSKLHQVEFIIDENELLNQKLIRLERLELENERLRVRIEQMKSIESQGMEEKEKIMQLQCVVVDQEDEIRRMLKHVKELTENYPDKTEIYQMRVELDEKDSKLKKYEKQLSEIPILELEIDKLKNKLQKCIEDFKADKDLLRRLQEELEACRNRCHELEELSPLCHNDFISNTESKVENKAGMFAVGECQELYQQPMDEKFDFIDKGENTNEVKKQENESQYDKPEVKDKTVLTVNDFINKSHEVEEQNKILKAEIERLTSQMSEISLEELSAQNNDLKLLLSAKEKEIIDLNDEINDIQRELISHENLKQILIEEVELLKEKTMALKTELCMKQEDFDCTKRFLEKEKNGRLFAISVIEILEGKLETEKAKAEAKETLLKLQKEEANLAKQEIYVTFGKEINDLKNLINVSKNLNDELNTENKLLRETKKFLERYEIVALKNLIARLRAEVAVLKSLSKPELESECEALHQHVKTLLQETDSLMNEINDLKSALDEEKSAKDSLEKEVINLQENLTACVAAGNAALEQKMSEKENIISNLQTELAGVKNNLENSVNESQSLKDKNEKLVENVNSLECEQKELKNQINALRLREEELKKAINEHEQVQVKLNKSIKEQEEKEKELLKTIGEQEEKHILLNKTVKEQEEKEKEFLHIIKEQEGKEKEFLQIIKEQEEKEKEYLKKIENFEDISAQVQIYKKELSVCRESADVMRMKINELELIIRAKDESLKLKEEELETTRNSSLDVKNELNRLKSEMDVLKDRLEESNTEVVKVSATDEDLQNYEKDLEEKYALEEALRKIENELDNLKIKLEECKTMEEEMSTLKSKKDSLLYKMSAFENEIECLKKKLGDLENVKNELDKLKAQKSSRNTEEEISNLYEQLLEQKALISNLKKENENLKEEISENENLLQVYKNLQNNISGTQTTPTTEFFTPPPMPSPRASEQNDSNPETIALEVHKKEINELENLHEKKIQNIIKLNAERLKKLQENYEKEAKSRIKIYYETINAIKSSYENDIKKLVEKHKMSIMRLQGLHEDEVQELNTTYETQMEAMQTQNENLINDLKTESAEKCKQLREQQNREIRDLTLKYEELFKEKEALFLEEKSKLEAENKSGMNHQKQIEDLKQFYENNMSEMAEKHCQELKKLKKSNGKKMELMKNKYEALLIEERKKYEEQLEEMLIQLRNDDDEERNDKAQKKPPPPTSPSLDFHEVLQKILNEGLECLSIEELILVHSKTCFIPQEEGEEDRGDREFSSRMRDSCRHKILMTAEKEELLKRIFTLEHEIVIKQLETHEAIVNMEAAEMCRIQELKNALCAAQQKNAELKQLLSNQTKYEMDLKIDRHILDRQAALHETNVMQKVKELEKVKAEKRHLEEELQMEKNNVKNLTAAMEAEKERHQIQRKRDAEYVESIRQRLEEALNHEQIMESQLDYEIKLRSRLEAEVRHFEQNFGYIPNLHPPSLEIEIKSAKTLTNQDEMEVTKEPRYRRSKSRHRNKLKTLNN